MVSRIPLGRSSVSTSLVLVFALAPALGAQAASPGPASRIGGPTMGSKRVAEARIERIRCGAPGMRSAASEKEKESCTRLPKKVVPWSLRAGKPQSPIFGGGSGPVVQLVKNEAGDELEVSAALPSAPYEEIFNSKCELIGTYVLAQFTPCGYVTFYDAKWETSSKAPSTNQALDAEYDACGHLVEGGVTKGWHNVGTEYITPGWQGGHHAWIPGSVSDSCLGTWTLFYAWTQKFSDGKTLSEYIEVPFLVTAVPLMASATWGGGNPSMLPCSQACHGDPVNTATGDYYETTTDLSIPGRGPGLDVTRSYSSLAARAGVSSPLGRGWSFSYDMSLSVDPESGDATVINGNGSRTEFEAGVEGFVPGPHVLATLAENEGGTYTYTVRERTIYTFDSSGKLTSIADLNGNQTTISYDESGRLQSAEDDAGRSIDFEFDELGRLESVSDSAERLVNYDYDESGYLEEVTDVRGGHTEFTYDEGGLLLTRTDPTEDTALTNTYDEAGRVETQTDGLEQTTSFFYWGTQPFTTTWVTNPRGYLFRYDYENGTLVEKREASNTAQKAVWTYERDPATLGITAVTDPNGHTSHATYDSRGNQTSSEDALGNKTESAYDSLNDLIEYTDAEGITTSYEYDESGNLLSASTPLVGSEPPKSRTVAYAHEDEAHPGDITTVTDPNGKATSFVFDAAGNLEAVVDPLGNETTYEYDELGRLEAEVRPRGNVEGGEPAKYRTTYEYDDAGNKLSKTNPLGQEREWAYDPNDNLEAETDANGHTTNYEYDAANRLISVERPNGQIEETEYDANGNVEVQVDGLKGETAYSYDPLDRLKTSTDPLGRSTEYQYDLAGNLVRTEDPRERFTYFDYDEANQLTEVAYGDETTPSVEYEYDDNGRRLGMDDGTGESTYEYDSLGRLIEMTDGHGDTTSYRHDLAGNVTSIGYPNGKTVTRAFDDAGRLEGVSDWLGNTTSFAYDANSNLESTTFPEGTGNVDEYAYDRADRMSGIEMTQGLEALATFGYTRDKVGQLEGLTVEGLPGEESEAFEYDENDRLIQAGSGSFEYDDANNLTKALGIENSFDAADQLKARAGLVYRYSRAGERIEAAEPTASYVSAFGSTGTEAGQFQHPAGIAVDAEGDVWVVDQENDRVQQFSEEGKYLGQFGSEGAEAGEFEVPSDVAIDSEGHLWVADSGNNRIQEFNQEGEFLSQFGSEGEEEGQLSWPEGLAVDSEGDIWVADTYNHRVQEFDPEGEVIQAFGEFGSEEGQIVEASAIAIDPEDNVWLADYSNFRVSEFDSEGEFVRQVGSLGSGDGEFEGPSAIDVDAEGNVWVVDEWNPRVQKFNKEGEYLGQFGEAGSGKGQFSFGWRVGIATDPQGNVWVADTENARVQRWDVPEAGGVAPTKYKYDGAGNLISVERPKAGETPAIEESYAYDGTGLRASQTVSETTSHLTWDQSEGLPLLLDDDQASYIYGPNGLPIEHIAEEKPTYYHHDQLGSTRMLTNSSGEATATFSYGAYGEPTGSTGSATTPLGFAGQYTNTESGLQYLRARVYDPAAGQFLTRDPIDAITRSPYTYAGNNPINFSDPTGLIGLPSIRDAATAYEGFMDGFTFDLTRNARDLLGIGDGGLELCGPLYEGSKVVGVGAASFLLPEVAPIALGRVAAFGRYASRLGDAAYESVLRYLAVHPRARWVVEHAESVYETGSIVAEYLKWIGRGMG